MPPGERAMKRSPSASDKARKPAERETSDREVILPFSAPLRERAGFLVLKGNLFDFAIMKTSVISEDFRARYLSRPGHENVFEGRAIVFDGSDDYHHRINDPALGIDENCILVIRGAGVIGWPGSAEVVNMTTGMSDVAGSLLSRVRTAQPSSLGIRTSRKIRSGDAAFARRTSSSRTNASSCLPINPTRCSARTPSFS